MDSMDERYLSSSKAKSLVQTQQAIEYLPCSLDLISNHFAVTLNPKSLFHVWEFRLADRCGLIAEKPIKSAWLENRTLIRQKLGFSILIGKNVYTLKQPLADNHQLRLVSQQKDGLHLQYIQLFTDLANLFEVEGAPLRIGTHLNKLMKDKIAIVGFPAFESPTRYFSETGVKLGSGFHYILRSGYNAPVHITKREIRIILDPRQFLRHSRNLWTIYKEMRRQASEKSVRAGLIIGKKFRTSYGKRFTYVIDGIDDSLGPNSPFVDKLKAKTFQEYFSQYQNVSVALDPTQFLVYHERHTDRKLAGTNSQLERIYFAPQLLYPVDLLEEDRRNPDFFERLSRSLRMATHQKQQLSFDLARKLHKETKVKELSVSMYPTVVPATYLGSVQIEIDPVTTIHASGKFSLDPIYRQNISGKKKQQLNNWMLVFTKDSKDFALKNLDFAVTGLLRAGFQIIPPVQLPVGKEFLLNPDLENLTRASLQQGQTIQLVWFVMTKKDIDSIYPSVKRQDIQTGIRTQFLRSTNGWGQANKPKLVVMANLMNKIWIKTGHTLWKVRFPPGLLTDRCLMAVGADVFHKLAKESVGAVVSNSDEGFTKYFCQFSNQKKRGNDLMEAIAESIIFSTREFCRQSQVPPKTIVVYRDGISDSMLEKLKEVEVKKLLHEFKEEYGEKIPQLVYCVVKKNIPDKFWMKAEKYGRLNPPPGTVIIDSGFLGDDRNYPTLCANEGFNPAVQIQFLMISQDVPDSQGCCKATKYFTVYNNSSFTMSELVQLTYHLCYTYSNSPGPTGVVGVLKSADKLAQHVGKCAAGALVTIPKETKQSLFF